MRPPVERDQCQAKLDILVEGFMGDDWDAYRAALVWLRDFTNQRNTERGRVMCGGNYWYTPQIKSVKGKSAVQQFENADNADA
jgi:hypothetical protein